MLTLPGLLKVLRRLVWLRGAVRGDRHEQFNKLYQVPDPWQMRSAREQDRFRQTSSIIQRDIGALSTLLEIGCGEGHQTEHLMRLCHRLHGFDVSATAVARARDRCPDATLSVADLFSYRPPMGLEKFDLVVACEVLYYLKDVPAAIARMSELGSCCLVSYLRWGRRVLDAYFTGIPDATIRLVHVGNVAWKVIWWKPQPSQSEASGRG